MKRLSDFADSLATEALKEMADSFFGERSDIDQEVDLFKAKADVLRQLGEEALDSAALLHALLLDSDAAPRFYTAINVPPGRLFSLVDPRAARLNVAMPRALTARRRFVKLFLHAYERTWEDFDVYMNGRYFDDIRNQGRKRLSMHYGLLRDWAGHINRRIRNVNEGHAPSCVLGFARSMDVIGQHHADIAGATFGDFACKLDQELSLPFVDMMALGVKELPALPEPQTVEPLLRSFASDLYTDNRARLDAIIARISSPPNPS